MPQVSEQEPEAQADEGQRALVFFLGSVLLFGVGWTREKGFIAFLSSFVAVGPVVQLG